ncbi:MAG: hypothetical protein Q9M11_05625 [Mariprofundaceae bacterium]|nr:hypothetical protein [Mariprofundaceae bacterium]
MTDDRMQLDDESLRKLIGRRVRYMNKAYEIIDLLLDDNLLILSADEGVDVQEDSYGRAHRMVPHQQNLRFRDADKKPSHIWDDLIFLDGPMETETNA